MSKGTGKWKKALGLAVLWMAVGCATMETTDTDTDTYTDTYTDPFTNQISWVVVDVIKWVTIDSIDLDNRPGSHGLVRVILACDLYKHFYDFLSSYINYKYWLKRGMAAESILWDLIRDSLYRENHVIPHRWANVSENKKSLCTSSPAARIALKPGISYWINAYGGLRFSESPHPLMIRSSSGSVLLDTRSLPWDRLATIDEDTVAIIDENTVAIIDEDTVGENTIIRYKAVVKKIAGITFYIVTALSLIRDENDTSSALVTKILLVPPRDGESYPFDTLEVWVKKEEDTLFESYPFDTLVDTLEEFWVSVKEEYSLSLIPRMITVYEME